MPQRSTSRCDNRLQLHDPQGGSSRCGTASGSKPLVLWRAQDFRFVKENVTRCLLISRLANAVDLSWRFRGVEVAPVRHGRTPARLARLHGHFSREAKAERSRVRAAMTAAMKGRVDEEVAHPHPSQTRMCRFPASGSSWKSLAHGGADDTIRDSPAKKDSR
jgi:hypothetical protein